MDFAPGLYCVTNDNINVHGLISGTNVTFYMTSPNFSMTFNGGGAFGAPASAPEDGEYDGVLIYLAPQFYANGNLIQTQDLQLLGNGSGDITGTIIAPSASVITRGNSGSDFNTQIIAWDVKTLSDRSVYLRYLSPMLLRERVTHERLSRVCDSDYSREIVLVIESQTNSERAICAVGRLNRFRGEDEEARMSLLVSDNFQGEGLGMELINRLIAVARKEKIKKIVTVIFQENESMKVLCKKAGFSLATIDKTEMIEASLAL